MLTLRSFIKFVHVALMPIHSLALLKKWKPSILFSKAYKLTYEPIEVHKQEHLVHACKWVSYRESMTKQAVMPLNVSLNLSM